MERQAPQTRALIALFIRIVNLFQKLDAAPHDLGVGERLYRSEIHVLEAVGRGEGRTVTGLGDSLGITKGAVSQVVSKLEAKGYLTKERNPGYSKEKLLCLSEKGRSAFEAHEAIHAGIDEDFFRSVGTISADELAGFGRLLELIEEYIRRAAARCLF
jgi:DNA-binding MarR family transcriptional regulator